MAPKSAQSLSAIGSSNTKHLAKLDNEGTVGVVKRCVEVSTGKSVAVKIINTRDEEIVLQLKKEFEHLVVLKSDHIVEVFELIIDHRNGKVYLVMECFEGKELFILLTETGCYNGWLRRDHCQGVVQTAAVRHHVPA